MEPLAVFAKRFILYVWQGFQYAYEKPIKNLQVTPLSFNFAAITISETKYSRN